MFCCPWNVLQWEAKRSERTDRVSALFGAVASPLYTVDSVVADGLCMCPAEQETQEGWR